MTVECRLLSSFLLLVAVGLVQSPLRSQQCITWDIKAEMLVLICRVHDFSKTLHFTDTFGHIAGNCTFFNQKPKCVSGYQNGNIRTNMKEQSITFTIPLQPSLHVNGNWTCWHGKEKHVASISTEKGIIDDTHVSLVGNVLNDKNGHRIELHCSSCREPYGNTVEFGKNGQSEASISYHRETMQCGEAGRECRHDICSCSASGNQFSKIFAISGNITNTFWCEVKFKDEVKGSLFKKEAKIQCDDKNCISFDTITKIIKHPEERKPIKEHSETDLKKNISQDDVTTKSPNNSERPDDKEENIKSVIITVLITLSVEVVGYVLFIFFQQLRKGKQRRKRTHEAKEGRPLLQEYISEVPTVYLCKPCKDLRQSAQFWCMECEVPLCTACKAHHTRLAITKNHNLVEVYKLPFEYILAENCKIHETCLLEYFCVDHDCLCCYECTVDTHRTCHKIQSVDLASKHINPEDSQTYTELLAQYNDVLEYVVLKRNDNIVQIQTDLKKKTKQLFQCLKDIHGEEIIKVNIDSINTKATIYVQEMKREISEATRAAKKISSRKALLNFISSSKSPKQLFLVIYFIKQLISDIEERVNELISNTKTVSLKLNKSSNGASLKFEEQKIDNIPGRFTMVSGQKFQSQCPVENKRRMRFEKDEQQLDLSHLDGLRISAITVSQNDWVFLCDCIRPNVLVYDENGHYRRTIQIFCVPWDIANIPGSDEAVLTSNFDDYIQFLDMKTLKAVKKVYLEDTAECGITCTDENILIGSRNKIFVLNYFAIQVGIIDDISEYDAVYRYLSYQNGKLFLNGYGTNSVICVDFADKKRCFRYHSRHLLNPKQIIFDKDGFCYALGRGSNNVIKLSNDGKCIDVPLTKEDGLKIPWSFCFSNDCTKLFLSNEKGSSVVVYKVTQQQQ